MLQEFFSKPFQLWERTSWNTFVHNTNQVLDVFANNQLDNVKTVASSDEAFFAKYLTSEKVCFENLKKSFRIFGLNSYWNYN